VIGRLRQFVRGRFPEALNAYHAFRQQRSLRQRRLTPTPHGFRFAGHEGMESGSFEPDETRLIGEWLAPGRVFVDVGANFGYYVCLARSRDCQPVAIEPLAQNLDMLYTNLEANGWADTEVVPVGLAASPGIATLYGGGTAASLLPNWAGTSEVFRRRIALSTLDIVVARRFEGQPLFVKIDVEGAELDVLRGASQLLARTPAPVWLVEICLTENLATGCNPHYAATFAEFWSRGYRAYSLEADMREVTSSDVERWVANGRRDFGYVSFVFRKDS
jgi:FkbM family methyltransferase